MRLHEYTNVSVTQQIFNKFIIHTELPLDAGHKVRPCAEYKNEKEPIINNKK